MAASNLPRDPTQDPRLRRFMALLQQMDQNGTFAPDNAQNQIAGRVYNPPNLTQGSTSTVTPEDDASRQIAGRVFNPPNMGVVLGDASDILKTQVFGS